MAFSLEVSKIQCVIVYLVVCGLTILCIATFKLQKRHAIIYMMDKLQNKIIELEKSISDDKTHGIDVGKKEVVLSTIKSEFFDYYCQVQKEE